MRRQIILGSMILLLLLSACSGKNRYEPFVPLSKVTMSPEREEAMQAALNGEALPPTAAPVIVPTGDPFDVPTFDEDSFFAEVSAPTSAPVVPTAAPTILLPTSTSMPPTVTPIPPEPTAVNPYGTDGRYQTYTLQEGDDLVCLGRRFGVSVQQLVSVNKLGSAEEAKPGDVIILPPQQAATPWAFADGYGSRMVNQHKANTVYTVKDGDTMFSIACYFGDVYPEKIAEKNGLLLGAPLTPGTQLVIP